MELFNHNIPTYSVTDLSTTLRKSVEERFSLVRVRGEVSKVTVHTNGHIYFSLKEDQSVLDAVCWKWSVPKLQAIPKQGSEMICTGKLSTFAGRSSYQMIVDQVEWAGEGAILAMIEKLKADLAKEGLFDPARKKPIPFFPEVIGVITSPTGAVIHDILHRLRDRCPSHVLLWPVVVQGDEAVPAILKALQGFQQQSGFPRPDLIIIARGGGSVEDLMPFNDERLVRAIAACHIPIITAVGHETDNTVVDLVADLRAPTPTAAAEHAVPVRAELLQTLKHFEDRMNSVIQRKLSQERLLLQKTPLPDLKNFIGIKSQFLDRAADRLQAEFRTLLQNMHARLAKLHLLTPRDLIVQKKLQLQSRSQPMDRALQVLTADKQKSLNSLIAKFSMIELSQKAEQSQLTLTDLDQRLTKAIHSRLKLEDHKLSQSIRLLESLSYKGILDRGFALIQTFDGKLLNEAAKAKSGEQVIIKWHDGEKTAKIQEDKR